MSVYLLKRLGVSILILLVVSLVSFYILQVAPGDPVSMYLQAPFRQVPQAVIDSVRHELGLDRPVLVQYLHWLRNSTRGNLGYSINTHQAVSTLVAQALPNTLILMAVALGLGLILGLALGVYSAVRPNSWADGFLSAAATLGYAVPPFWAGLTLIYVFSFVWRVLPSAGMMDPFATHLTLGDLARHLVLPAGTLALREFAMWQRYQRDSLITVLHSDFIRTARAKGLSQARVLYKHAWRNSLAAIITLLGLSLSRLLTGSYIIESIFSWPGMGYLGIAAINNRDYPVVMAILMLSAVVTIAGNLLADIGCSLVDPRVRMRRT